MDTMQIRVADYYGIPSYYSVMPERLFTALETAFVNGQIMATVSIADFRQMREAYIRKMA